MSERLRVVLEFDDGGFVKGIETNNSRLKQFGKNIIAVDNKIREAEKSAGSWGRKLKDTAVTLASLNYLIPNLTNVLFGWQRSIIGANAELEQSVAIMKNFSTEISDVAAELEARNFVDMITQKAAEAPFSIDALTDSIVKMKAAGLDNAEQGFNALVDSVAAFGGTDTTLKRASVAISQMSGKGVISMEELRQQLGEAVPSAINIMATSLNTTYSELVKEISKGNVRSDIALVSMFEEMERQLDGSALRMMDTWNGLMAQLSTATTINMRVFGQEGYFDEIKAQLADIVSLLNEPSTKRFFADMSQGAAELVRWLSEAVKWVFEHKDAIATLGIAYLAYTRIVKNLSSTSKSAFGAMSESVSKYVRHQEGARKLAEKAYNKEYNLVSKNDALYRKYFSNIAEGILSNNVARVNAGKSAVVVTQEQMEVMARHRRELDATSAAMGKYNAVIKRTSVSAKLFKGVMRGIPGLLMSIVEIAATTMLAKMITGWGDAERAVKKNIEALKEYKGLYADVEVIKDNRNHLESLREELVSLEKLKIGYADQIKLLEERKKAIVANGGNMMVANSLDEEIERLKDLPNRIAAVKKEINDLKLNLGTATQLAIDSEKEKEGRVIAANVSSEIEAAQRLYKKIVKDTDTQLKNMMADANLSEAEKLKAGDEAGEAIEKARIQNLETQIKAYTEQRKRLENEIAEKRSELTNAESVGDKESLRIEIQGKIAALQSLADKVEELKNPPTSASLVDALLNGKGSDGDNDIKSTIEVVDKEIARLNGKLAEFANRTNKSGGEFESFVASLGEMAKNEKVTGKLDEIKLKMEEVFANTKYEKTEASFDKFITKLGETEEAARSAFNEKSSESLNLSTKNATKYQIAIQGLIKDIDKYVASKDADKAAEMTRVLEQGKSIAKMQDMSALYTEITNKNLRLEEQLGKQSEGQGAYYDGLIANAKKILDLVDKETEGYEKTSAALRVYINNLKEMKTLKGESKSVLLDHMKDWDNLKSNIGDVKTEALDGFVDVLTNGLTGASSGFSDFADSIIESITRMIVKFIAMKAITSALGMFGGSNGGGADSALGDGVSTMNLSGAQPVYSAKGNIVGQYGAMPLKLKEYATGGIATSPQLSIFGEGSRPEAYVPLPDGRTIPVTMKGGSGNVQVNIYNQSGQSVEGESNTRFDGEKMIVDVMLKHFNQPGRVRDSLRGI